MNRRVSLNGNDWQLKGFMGEDWAWHHAHEPGCPDSRWWCQGTVPGSVHNDLWQAGEIPDPYYERNSLRIEWVPERTWVYKKTFFADPADEGKRVRLHFKGVDYEARFFLNGEQLGSHRGMYTPAVFEVGAMLKYGEGNLLAVVIDPPPHEQPQVGRTSQVRTHKSRMTYWWDFCPRMIHVGIWDEVSLEITGPVRIEDVFVRPHLSNDLSQAAVTVSTALSTTRETMADVETTIRYQGRTVASRRRTQALSPGQTDLAVRLEVEQPQLWWPNGHGEQALYEAEVTVIDRDDDGGAESDRRRTTFGIRRVELVANETADTTARPYTFVVNGRRLYIKGWNWVPLDVMYGVERPEKLERLLTLARRAHVNLLRVWGGGLIEKEAFYDLCDRHGIMVWQEFIQSSSGIDNHPSHDSEFVRMMVREAGQIIPRKRNHPSLVIWCGGNELQDERGKPLDDGAPVLGALHQVVERLDLHRHWLPTSPSGPTFGNSLEAIARDPLSLHDVHGPWEHQGLTAHYTLYNQGTSLFHSEFGVEGITNLSALNASISKASQWPVNCDNPVFFHRGAWWIKESRLEEAFGEIGDIETLVAASQLLQAEGLRYAVESNRRRKYQNSGSLPWQFNEPYPNSHCTSAVDYYAEPKPAYYAVARAYEPVHVTAQFPTQAWQDRASFEAEIWVANSYDRVLDGAIVHARIVGARGVVYHEQQGVVACAANRSTHAMTFAWPFDDLQEDIFFLDLRLVSADGSILSRNRYLFSRTADLAPMFLVPATTLDISVEDRGDHLVLTLTNTGDHVALFLWLQDGRGVPVGGYVAFDDNHFCLLPDERRTISVEWHEVPSDERTLELRGWNSAAVVVGRPGRSEGEVERPHSTTS